MLWEALVTDGHVRSARLRRIQPWIVALSLVLLWLGLWIASLAPTVRHESSVQSILQQRITTAQQRAEAALAGVPRPVVAAAAAALLPPFAEVAGVIEETLKSLDASGDLPTAMFDFVESDRNALWKGDWTPERLHYLRSGDTLLVGALVNGGMPTRVQPLRWLGAFKKFGDRWQYCSLPGPGFAVPREQPSARAGQIAQSLAPLLPDER